MNAESVRKILVHAGKQSMWRAKEAERTGQNAISEPAIVCKITFINLVNQRLAFY